MANVIVIGAQWGDEGKGKITDLLSRSADVVVRSQGGVNAGHTVVVQDQTFKLHLIPSGILYPDTECIIGSCTVIDPQVAADPLPPRRRNRAWEKFRRSPSALLGGVIVIFFLLVAISAPLLPVPGPTETDWGAVRKAPTWAHPFGTAA